MELIMLREEGEITPVGIIVSERYGGSDEFLPVIERVIKTPDGEVREPQFLWSRNNRKFSIAFAITEEGNVVLVREPKYGQMDRFDSLPSGGVEVGESPIEAVVRELLEETGYSCESWEAPPLQSIVDFPDKTDGGEHFVFLGRNARRIGQEEKFRETYELSFDELRHSIFTGSRGGERFRMPAMSIAAAFIVFEYLK